MSERILIADDSLPVREAAEAALAARQARLELVPDGGQALEQLRQSPPDLLIADVHMPGLDGYALCREAKSARPETRVLLLVGTFEPFDAAASKAAGADGVVRKPFVPSELQSRVEDLLGRPPVAEVAGPVAAESAPAPPPEEPVAAAPPTVPSAAVLSDADVDRVARRVLELGGEAVLERVARELLGGAVAERLRAGAAGSGAGDAEPE